MWLNVKIYMKLSIWVNYYVIDIYWEFWVIWVFIVFRIDFGFGMKFLGF